MGAERPISYPRDLEILIDTETYLTSGRAVEEELLTGSRRSRVWVEVVPLTSNGNRLSKTRLVAEEGCEGLRARAERAQHLQQGR